MTDEPTPDQRAAYGALEDAIVAVARARGYLEPGEIATGWVVVASSQNAGLEGHTGYFNLYPLGGLPSHTAAGLLRVAEARILSRHRADRDDEE